jgi:outer membrane protein assembly factor BamE
MMRKLLINISIIASLGLAGCSSNFNKVANSVSDTVSEINMPNWDIPGVYRIPIQQGNLITQEMVNELKPGMTKQQVRYLLGTPLLIDTFQEDRWEYLYTNRPGSKRANVEIERERLELLFKNGRLQKISGDMYPQGEELAKITKEESRERTIVIPPDAPRNEDDISFIEAILDKATGKSKDDPVIKNEAPEESAEQEK